MEIDNQKVDATGYGPFDQAVSAWCFGFHGFSSAHASQRSILGPTEPLAADSEPPSPPRNLVARAASAREVVLSWAPPERGEDVAGYYVWRDGVKLTTVSDPSCTQHAMAGLKTPVTQYSFAVSAFDAAGNEGEPSGPAIVEPGTREA